MTCDESGGVRIGVDEGEVGHALEEPVEQRVCSLDLGSRVSTNNGTEQEILNLVS